MLQAGKGQTNSHRPLKETHANTAGIVTNWETVQRMAKCSNCNKINHFAAVCLSRPKKESVCQLQTGHAEYSDVESDYDDLNVLALTPELQTNAVTAQQYPRKLFAMMHSWGKARQISDR